MSPDQIREKFDEISEQRAEMIGELATMDGNVKTLCATVTAYIETSKTEIRALFAKARDTVEKVENIRVDYVRKQEFEAHKNENRDDLLDTARVTHARIEKMDERISSLAWKVASASGGVSLLITVLGLIAQYFRK